MSSKIQSDRVFTRKQVNDLLNAALNKTLLEVDKARIFEKHSGRIKVTGVAGDIVEISILGCSRNSIQAPDLIIDGVPTELKTTGMVEPKKRDSLIPYECKEPVSITAVSIPTIVGEEFETSNFWHKLEHLLWVYYWYKSSKTVTLETYKTFPIIGFQFYEFSEDDRLRLKEDWLLVRDFLIVIHRDYPTQAERDNQYPRLSSELRGKLLLIDTAPKYPHSPRFRLKRSFATVIASQYFSQRQFEKLAKPITKYTEVDEKCEQLTAAYSGKSFEEIARELGIQLSSGANSHGVTVKNFAEQVVLKMFGSNAKRLNDIEDFAKIGVIAKSLPLTKNGYPKESMKMFTPDFEEWVAEESFEESFLRSYFAENQFILIVYEYTHPDAKNKDPKYIVFKEFKRVVISEDFIENQVKRFWTEVRSLIRDKRLEIVKAYKKDGTPIINQKSGSHREAPNFPKEADSDVFMRGSAPNADESNKTLIINGLRMLPQEVWLSKRATFKLFNN
ncbi:MAG: hypothetical protein IJJ83_04050 [Muribaculaceae bacterium]|nr:hypothetical protein [Muribaculaceae bacterium]